MSIENPTEQELREELGSPSSSDISSSLLTRLLEEEGSFYGAALRAANILSRKFAQKANLQVGRYKEEFLDRAKVYREMSADFERKIEAYGALPFFGGTSLRDKVSRASDPDRPPSDFRRAMMEDHWT